MDETNHDDNGDSNEDAGIVDVNVAGGVGDDVEMASPEEETEPLVQATGPRDSSGEDKGIMKVSTGPKESGVVMALLNCETKRYADEASDGRRLRASSTGKQTERADVVVPDGVGVESCRDKRVKTDGGATEQVGSQQSCTEDRPLGVKKATIKNRCSFPGCEKWPQAHRLCYVHGGYRTCKIDSCSRKATTGGLCRQHGGGTRCSTNGCQKMCISGGHGHCYKHACAQGFELKAKCTTDGCKTRSISGGHGHCFKHARSQGYMKKTECSADGCETTSVSGGHGHCFKHARAQGYMKKTECSTDGCEKSSFPGGHGHCFKHACAQGFEMKAKCKADGCNKLRVGQRFCLNHNASPPNSQSSKQLNAQSSKRGIKRRGSHVTCKATGCLKWVKRDGDTNEYCDNHQDRNVLREGNSMATANQEETTGLGMCKEPGCTNTGIYGAEKRGYCFRHGGGYRCKVDGCPKARQRHGLCSSHGGKSECKVEGCEKRAAVRGCCRRHYQECLASEMAALQ
jgi:hypothetical protein